MKFDDFRGISNTWPKRKKYQTGRFFILLTLTQLDLSLCQRTEKQHKWWVYGLFSCGFTAPMMLYRMVIGTGANTADLPLLEHVDNNPTNLKIQQGA